MRKYVLIIAMAGLATTASVAATSASAASLARKVPAAKLSMAQARATALRVAPGKVIKSEYEKEGGAWRYSFDIRQKNHIQEIGVNAMTGKIVENKSEGKTDHD